VTLRRRRGCGTPGFLLILAVISVICHLCIHVFAIQLSSVVGASQREARTASRAGAPGLPVGVPRGAVAAAGSRMASRTIRMGCEGGLNVLLIHEHHLKAIGSDLRLLGLLLQLREQGHTVSLLFRGKASRAERSPPTSELYRIIGGPELDNPVQLSGGGKPTPHPAIYEMVDLAGLAGLVRAYYSFFCVVFFLSTSTVSLHDDTYRPRQRSFPANALQLIHSPEHAIPSLCSGIRRRRAGSTPCSAPSGSGATRPPRLPSCCCPHCSLTRHAAGAPSSVKHRSNLKVASTRGLAGGY